MVLGILGACSGFLCLLLAISGAVAPAFWFTIVIVGGVLAGIGIIMALIAAACLTCNEDDEQDISEGNYQKMDDSKTKYKPYFGVSPTLNRDDGKNEKSPELSSASKDHIYRMTLNLGSVDIRSSHQPSPPQDVADEEGEKEASTSDTTQILPGLSDGTKSFRD